MKEEILTVFEDFVVENWGRLVLEDVFSAVGLIACSHRSGEKARHLLAELNLPRMLGLLATNQKLDLADVVYAFGKFCFPYFASRLPRHDRAYDHPKQFLMAMHDQLSFEDDQSGFVHFHYVDCGPEELLMIYKTRQSFSSFVEGFVAGAAESFSHLIECKPVTVREGEVNGCRFHLTFKGEF